MISAFVTIHRMSVLFKQILELERYEDDHSIDE